MKVAALFSSNPRRNPYGYGVLALLLVCLGLVSAPGFLFAESSHFGGMTIYSHAASAGLAADVAQAQASLSRSAIDAPEVSQQVFLTASAREFALFAPSSAHAFGATYFVPANTFLAPSDAAADRIHADRAGFNSRPLSAVIAHERTHVLLQHHFGTLRMLRAPAWKQEGYCDYIAGGASIPTDAEGLALLHSPAQTTPAVAYFRDTLRVRFLLDRKHLTVDQLFAQTLDTAALDREAEAFYGSQDSSAN